MTFIDLFAGIGGIRLGMEQTGHTCLGHCEIDKYANIAYTAIYKPKGEEWFAEDITRVRATDIPTVDCWCFGFPCQDISISGKGMGFSGERSSLFFTVTKLIYDTKEEDRPTYLLIENVKNLLSINRGFDFLSLLTELDEIGYDAEWDILNSKNFGVPQNRERLFIVGHNRKRCTEQVFPITGASSTVHPEKPSEIDIIGTTSKTQKGVVYGINGICGALMATDYKEPKTIMVDGTIGDFQTDRIYNTDGIAPTVMTHGGGGHEIKIIQRPRGFNKGGVHDIAPTITSHTWNENNYLLEGCKIRKLTPLEYWRLQGMPDELFYNAQQAGLSNSQLYKLAGNGVTVPVIYEIAKKMSCKNN